MTAPTPHPPTPEKAKLEVYTHVRVMFEEADLGFDAEHRDWIIAVLTAVEEGSDLRTALRKANGL